MCVIVEWVVAIAMAEGVGPKRTSAAGHFWLAGCGWLLSHPRQPIGSKDAWTDCWPVHTVD
jgi:hypothetical protein